MTRDPLVAALWSDGVVACPTGVGPPGAVFPPEAAPHSGRGRDEDEDWPEWLARVGGRVREGRVRCGLTTEALARTTAIPAAALAWLESGEPAHAATAAQVARLDVLHLFRLATLLQVPLPDLVGDPGQSPLDTTAWWPTPTETPTETNPQAPEESPQPAPRTQRGRDRRTPDEATFLIALGRRARLARIANDLSQHELAHRCGIPRALISATERGARTIDLLRLSHLAAALPANVSHMITGATPANDQPRTRP